MTTKAVTRDRVVPGVVTAGEKDFETFFLPSTQILGKQYQTDGTLGENMIWGEIWRGSTWYGRGVNCGGAW